MDNITVISTADLEDTKNFLTTLKKIANKLDIPLAPPCPKFEKAFDQTNKGTVLGIIFNSENMTWKMPPEKTQETLELIKNYLLIEKTTLLDFQKLHGKLNDFTQLNIFLKGFKFNQNNFLENLNKFPEHKKSIPPKVKKELQIWANVIIDTKDGLPIPTSMELPPTSSIKFISDAAGRPSTDKSAKIGVASLGHNEENIFFAGRIWWPEGILEMHGHNSTLLESIGLLIPFLTIPEKLENQYITLQLDNTAVYYGWRKKYLKNCELTSIIIQTIHIIEALLPCKIFIEHTERNSNKMAKTADALSRQKTENNIPEEIPHIPNIVYPKGSLLKWLAKPETIWTLPFTLANEAINLKNRRMSETRK